MDRHRPGAIALVAAAALAVSLGGPRGARAEEALGPPIGSNGYRAALRSGLDGPDHDEFRAELMAGETLSVAVTSPFQSPLFPALEVIDPSGAVRPLDGLRSRAFGKRLSVRGIPIDTTGVWTVRVGGLLQTEGPYRIRFRVRPPAPIRLEAPAVPPGTSAAVTQRPFEALEGARLHAVLASRHGGPPATFSSLADPAAREVPGVDAARAVDGARGKRRAVLRDVPLSAGDGAYTLSVTAPAGNRGYVLTLRLRPPKRPRGTRALSPEEPWLEPRTEPLRSAPGLEVRLEGRDFSRPRVFFGDREALEIRPDPSGNWIDVVVPEGPPGALVDVAVVNGDEQGVLRADYFEFAQPPVLLSLTDLAGRPVLGDTPAGGKLVRLHGAHFRTGHIVEFGGVDVVPLILDPTLIEISVPPRAPGLATVAVVDSFEQASTLEEPFEYKAPPTLGAGALDPQSAAPGTPVRLRGGGFEPDDVLFVDGEPATSTLVGLGERLFLAPDRPPGPVVIELVDRIGSTVRGPDLELE